MSRWDRRLQVSRVDDRATHVDVMKLTGAELSDVFTVIRGANVLVAGQHSAAAGPREPLHYLGEVRADIVARRTLVEPGVLTGCVDAVFAERERVHAIEGRGCVQAHERIRVNPVASWRMSTFDYRHLDVRLGHQRIGKGKAGRSGAHDQAVGTGRHSHLLAPPRRARKRSPASTTISEFATALTA